MLFAATKGEIMPRSIVRWGVAGFVLALAAAGPAFAQGDVLQAGGFVEGEVDGSDTPVTVSLRATPGQTLQLDALPAPRSPEGLDLLLKVYDADGELVAQDDDGGGGLNPRLTLVSDEGGLYRVEVGVLNDGGGKFTLLARETVYVPEVLKPLAMTGGRAEQAVAFPADDDALFTFSGKKGEVYSITLTADPAEGDEAADPMLELFPGEGTKEESLATDDDGGGALNSRIVTELADDGTYTVRVSSLSSKGSAQLAVARMTLRPAAVGNLAYGAPATVSFGPDSPFVLGESARPLVPYALFRLPASPAPRAFGADKITITATSEGLDPWLEVGFDTPLGFATILSNDDADGLNSRLELDPSKFAGSDAADWWNKLRVRVSAPAGSTGDIQVNAVRGSE
jgi:hypothetical protein